MTKEIYLTDIERKLRDALVSYGYRQGIDFAIQFPIRNSFILDFAFPKLRVAIEADGEPWHSNPISRRRDRFKDYILKKLGWNVIRFSGKDIYESIQSCIEKIVTMCGPAR